MPSSQLDEHVRAVVDAQSVAGAQVLVDPHPHGAANGTAGCLHWLDRDRTRLTDVPTAPPPSPDRHPVAEQDHTLAPPDRRRRRPVRLAARRRRPRHARLPRGRERRRRPVLRTPRRHDRDHLRRDQSRGSRRPTCRPRSQRPLVVRHPHHRGVELPDPLSWPRPPSTPPSSVLLDENVEAEGHDFFDLGAFDVSPGSPLLAWSSDIDGGEQYTLRIRDLDHRRRPRRRRIDDTSNAGVAWSRDGQWVFYVTARRAEATVPGVAPPAGHRQRPTTCCVLEETDERFFVGVGSTRTRRSGSSSTRPAEPAPTRG